MKRTFLLLLILCMMHSGCKAIDTPANENGTSSMPLTTSNSSNVATPESSGILLNDEEAIKNTVYDYFSSRHEIRANITSEPFDAQSDAVLKLLGCCAGDEFINETLITRQMEYEQKQIVGQRREMDMSYQSYEFDIEYKSIDIDGQMAKVNVLDEVTFRLAADPEIESVAGDWHDLQLEKRDGEWKITGDECDMAGYYAQQYKAYKAKCGQEDILSINEYVLEQFRNEVIAGLEAAGF
jgi:hypothetical protein